MVSARTRYDKRTAGVRNLWPLCNRHWMTEYHRYTTMVGMLKLHILDSVTTGSNPCRYGFVLAHCCRLWSYSSQKCFRLLREIYTHMEDPVTSLEKIDSHILVYVKCSNIHFSWGRWHQRFLFTENVPRISCRIKLKRKINENQNKTSLTISERWRKSFFTKKWELEIRWK